MIWSGKICFDNQVRWLFLAQDEASKDKWMKAINAQVYRLFMDESPEKIRPSEG